MLLGWARWGRAGGRWGPPTWKQAGRLGAGGGSGAHAGRARSDVRELGVGRAPWGEGGGGGRAGPTAEV